jgi:hypothetical protein
MQGEFQASPADWIRWLRFDFSKGDIFFLVDDLPNGPDDIRRIWKRLAADVVDLLLDLCLPHRAAVLELASSFSLPHRGFS